MVDEELQELGRVAVGADFDALRAWALELTEGYDAGGFDPRKESDLKQAKRDRAYFNGLVRDIDQRRKAVKAAYMEPLKAFEDGCKTVTGILQAAADQAGAVVAEGDRLYKEAKEQALRDHFEAFAGELVRVMTYEQLADPAWLNRTCPLAKAKDELTAKVERVARDWETLTGFVGQPGYAAARRAFCETLSLAEALRAGEEATATDRSIQGLDESTSARRGQCRATWAVRVFGATDAEVAQIMQCAADMGLRAVAEKQDEEGNCDER